MILFVIEQKWRRKEDEDDDEEEGGRKWTSNTSVCQNNLIIFIIIFLFLFKRLLICLLEVVGLFFRFLDDFEFGAYFYLFFIWINRLRQLLFFTHKQKTEEKREKLRLLDYRNETKNKVSGFLCNLSVLDKQNGFNY